MQNTTAAPAGIFGFLFPLKRNGEFLMHKDSYKEIQKDHVQSYAFEAKANEIGFYVSEREFHNHVLIRMSNGRKNNR